MRYVGNVRNVVLCNVTTEKRSVPVRTAVLVRLYSTVVLYCTFAFSVQQKFNLLSLQGFGQQDQIRSAASDPVEF